MNGASVRSEFTIGVTEASKAAAFLYTGTATKLGDATGFQLQEVLQTTRAMRTLALKWLSAYI